MQISDVKHSTLNTMLSVIYNDKMNLNNMEQASTNFLISIFI